MSEVKSQSVIKIGAKMQGYSCLLPVHLTPLGSVNIARVKSIFVQKLGVKF